MRHIQSKHTHIIYRNYVDDQCAIYFSHSSIAQGSCTTIHLDIMILGCEGR